MVCKQYLPHYRRLFSKLKKIFFLYAKQRIFVGDLEQASKPSLRLS
jgi:hypothetical protein